MNKINVNKDGVKSFKLSKVHQQIDNYHRILIDNAKEYYRSVYNDKDYILIVKDSLNDENKYVVRKKIYDKINIGDKYFK